MPSSPFAAFAATAEAVAATTSKLRKRDLLAAYLHDLPPGDVPIAATFCADSMLVISSARRWYLRRPYA